MPTTTTSPPFAPVHAIVSRWWRSFPDIFHRHQVEIGRDLYCGPHGSMGWLSGPQLLGLEASGGDGVCATGARLQLQICLRPAAAQTLGHRRVRGQTQGSHHACPMPTRSHRLKNNDTVGLPSPIGQKAISKYLQIQQPRHRNRRGRKARSLLADECMTFRGLGRKDLIEVPGGRLLVGG